MRDTCDLVYIDAAGEKAVARITFASQGVPPASSPGGTSTPPAGPGILPFSGFGAGLWRLNQIGGLLSFLGGAMILVGYRSRLADTWARFSRFLRTFRPRAVEQPIHALWIRVGHD
jgi:hypothetical protein